MADPVRVAIKPEEELVISPQKEAEQAIRISPPPEEEKPKVKFVKKVEPIKIQFKEPIKVDLNLRKALNGDYMIFDHPLFDIVLMPKKNKIVTFIRKNSKIDAYSSQDDFFEFLRQKGMIIPDSIQGGNVYGSLEAAYPINNDADTIQMFLYLIYNYMEEKGRSLAKALDYEEDVEELYSEPSEEDSTEFGEVPHAEKKGSIDPGRKPYGLIYRL
tara:strand:- start:588 stop:1232 length:645 start_codon:yes stop_codon:yes gene_type:complete